MKKIYFLFLSVFMVGGLMAQSGTTTTEKTTLNKETKKGAVNVNTESSRTSTSNINSNNNTKVGVDQSTEKKPVVQTETIVKYNETNKSEGELLGFPKYVNTGNKELDDANYMAAKDLWIQNNQELYNQHKGIGSGKTATTNPRTNKK